MRQISERGSVALVSLFRRPLCILESEEEAEGNPWMWLSFANLKETCRSVLGLWLVTCKNV
jgi:hypothetical protein